MITTLINTVRQNIIDSFRTRKVPRIDERAEITIEFGEILQNEGVKYPPNVIKYLVRAHEKYEEDRLQNFRSAGISLLEGLRGLGVDVEEQYGDMIK